MQILESMIMKREIYLLLILLTGVSSVALGQSKTLITKSILPLNKNVPVVYQENVKGGFHQVAGSTERDAIVGDMKETGMVVSLKDSHATYQWDGLVWRQIQLVRNWEEGATYYSGDLFLYSNTLVIAQSDGTVASGDNPLTDTVNWSVNEQLATNVSYSNTTSGLSSATVQAALDELAESISSGEVPSGGSTPDGASASAGDIFYNTTDNTLYVYTGTEWVEISIGGSTPSGSSGSLPATGTSGDTFYTEDTNILYVYNGTDWVAVDTDDQTATEVTYSNSTSGLSSATVQAALDELAESISSGEVPSGGSTPDGASASAGDIFYNTTDNTLYVYTGTEWVEISIGGSTPSGSSGSLPATGTSGDTFYTEDTNILYVYNGTDWVAVDTDDQTATEVTYSNTTSGLSSSTVQAAIDELSESISSGEVPSGGSTPDGASASAGDIFYNTTDNVLYVYTGTEWVEISIDGSTPSGTSASLPATGSTGDTFYTEDTDIFYVYNGTDWVAVNTDDQTAAEVNVTASGNLTSTNVQAALEELQGDIDADVDLSSSASGVLPIANGGTGSSTQSFVDLSNSQTIGGAKTFSDDATFTGNIALNGGSLNTSAATASLFNTTATTVNIGGAATDLRIGSSTGGGATMIRNALSVSNGSINTSATTASLFNTTATTVNIAGAASYIVLGKSTTNNTEISANGNLGINGGGINLGKADANEKRVSCFS